MNEVYYTVCATLWTPLLLSKRFSSALSVKSSPHVSRRKLDCVTARTLPALASAWLGFCAASQLWQMLPHCLADYPDSWKQDRDQNHYQKDGLVCECNAHERCHHDNAGGWSNVFIPRTGTSVATVEEGSPRCPAYIATNLENEKILQYSQPIVPWTSLQDGQMARSAQHSAALIDSNGDSFLHSGSC